MRDQRRIRAINKLSTRKNFWLIYEKNTRAVFNKYARLFDSSF